MKRRTTADNAVTLIVRNEQAQGLRARERRQLRGSSILSVSCPDANSNCCLLGVLYRLFAGGDGYAPLGGDCARPMAFSAFLRSRVSKCFVKSYLAEVELFFLPSLLILCLLGVAVSDWVSALLLVSSAQPDSFLIIEPRHKTRHHEKCEDLSRTGECTVKFSRGSWYCGLAAELSYYLWLYLLLPAPQLSEHVRTNVK